MRHSARFASTALAILALQAPLLARQPAADADVDERSVVVVRDTFVDAGRGKLGGVEDLSVTLDGRAAPIVALATSDDEPLDTLVVLDGALGDTTELRRAAFVAAELAETLTELGSVRLVVLRPDETEELVGWTSNGARVERALSRLGIEGSSEELLSAARLPFTAAEALGESPTPGEAEDAARATTLAIVRHVDRLVELAAEPTRTARRLLLLAGGGFDPCPAAFFGAEEIAPEHTGCDAKGQEWRPGGQLGPTLATLGWTVAALLPPEPDDAKAWRFGMLDRVEQAPTSPGAGGPALFGVTIKINQERKPKRARAYLRQARVHLDEGDLDAAEEAGRKAIHHFAEGRKTRKEEADAWRLVAAVHARRGEAAETSRTLLRAQRLAPREGPESAPERLAKAYRDARRPLERLAEATGGTALYAAEELASAVADLAERPRVTYQFPDPVAVEPLRLEARVQGEPVEATAWASPSPTPLVSLAAARKLLRGARSDRLRRPRFGVFVPDDAVGADGPLQLYLELSTVLPDVRRWSEGPWRVTVLHSELDAEQHHVAPPEREPGSERFALEVELGTETPIELILVEDLATGAWGFQAR